MIRWKFALAAILLLLSGCEWLDKLSTVKVDNPVMGPPPPRTAMTDERATGGSMLAQKDTEKGPIARGKLGGGRSGGLDVTPVDFANSKDAEKNEISPTLVVATVNGSPIFAAEVLEPYQKQLTALEREKHVSPQELYDGKMGLIRKDLPGYVQNRIVVSALLSTLKKEQLEPLQKHLDELFQQMVNKKKKQLGIHSDYEFDLKLQSEDGTSLASLRTTFHNRGMAQAYLESKSKSQDAEVTRDEMLAYYKEHVADYSFPASVEWQQIAVNFQEHGGKKQAFEIFETAVEALKQPRADFDEIAKKYSDDPKAANGGRWGWAKQGSLSNKQIDKLLFELPPGTISAPVVGEDAFRVVKIIQRKAGGRTSFADVQGEIKKKLTTSREKQSGDEVLAKLREKATITTIFDGEQKKTEASPFE